MGMYNLKDKVAIVTGGGSGIGKYYVLKLAQEGASVAIADIDFEAAEKIASEVNSSGGKALAISVDVCSEQSTVEMAKKVADKFGRIDILVNNAALYTALEKESWNQIDLEEWNRVMAVNVNGIWLCCRAVFPYMKQQRRGKIINISSGVALGSPFVGLLHYTTSKGAVIAFTRGLAREVGDYNINVNTVTAGLVKTERTLMTTPKESFEFSAQKRCLKRVEKPEDLAGTIAFLASEDSNFITGQILNVDGGNIMH